MLESQAAFASRLGMSRSYVTQLKQAGRLVMQGDMVDVEASLARIEATRDPSKAYVAERHADDRRRRSAVSGMTGGVMEVGGDRVGEPGASEQATGIDIERVGIGYKLYRARKMRADAEIAEMERDRLAGRLMLRESVEFAVTDLATLVRARLEALPDRLAPVLYPLQTMDETRAALVEAIEEVLQALAQQTERRMRELESGHD